ncbi:MAG: phosphomannomutase/phosphoglucomutase, partial [Gammaproteobacteria bacterium]
RQQIRPVPGQERAPAEIFKTYDIRGIVGETLTRDIVFDIGRAIGSEAKEQDCKTVVVARDGRESSLEFATALSRGLTSTGLNILDLGLAATPVLYFVAHHTQGRTGVMVTGSHNPPEYNGFKVIIKGVTLSGERIQRLKERIDNKTFVNEQEGKIDQNSMFVNEYIGMIAEDVHLVRPMKIAIDCGNGATSEIAPVLFKTLGCEVIELYCEVDGSFPNHHPDPSNPENLSDLISAVRHHQADVGIAFDGDGDRIGVVDSNGKIIWPDRQMMLFAKDVLARKPGTEIIYDVKCSKHLSTQIKKFGGRPLMWKTGHSLMKAKLKETGARLAGEMSGHIFFNDRWFGFDDALYAAARLIEIISSDSRTSAEVFADFPDSVNTPELNVPMAEGENTGFVEQLKTKTDFKNGKITDIDGLRVDFDDGWGLVRASNTTPSLVVRFEADTEQALRRIQREFKTRMQSIKPDIVLPF